MKLKSVISFQIVIWTYFCVLKFDSVAWFIYNEKITYKTVLTRVIILWI